MTANDNRLTRDDVMKTASLARLRLTDAEADTMAAQLSKIVQYIHQLNELDTSDVAPMAHAVELTNVFADDIPEPSLDRAEALANAPKKDDECYRVPAVLG